MLMVTKTITASWKDMRSCPVGWRPGAMFASITPSRLFSDINALAMSENSRDGVIEANIAPGRQPTGQLRISFHDAVIVFVTINIGRQQACQPHVRYPRCKII